MNNSRLEKLAPHMNADKIQIYLMEQGLGDDAEKLAHIIFDHCLTWKVPEPKVDRVDAIVAFAFGNRIDDYGNRTPGPINALLADAVESMSQKFNCTVVAQWEIANLLYGRISEEKLVSVNPRYDAPFDKIIYLSSAGIMEQVQKVVDENASLYIVAHRDHLYRCVQIAKRFGFSAVCDSDKMPADYDPQSSQAWTRNRETYLVSDMISRLAAVRRELIESS